MINQAVDPLMFDAVGQPSQAFLRASAERALCLDETNLSAMSALALYWTNQGKFEIAESYCLSVISAESHEWSALGFYLLAELRYQQSELEQAKGLLGSALGKLPCNAAFWSRLGLLHLCSGGFKEAFACYDSALSFDPSCVFSTLGRVYARYKLGAFKPTRDALDELIELAPGEWYTHYFAGRIEQEEGNIEKARACLLRSLELDPENLWSLSALEALGLAGKNEGS